MSSRVLGVDLGAYSVKVVVSSPGFRQALVTQVIEQLVPEGEEPHLIRAAAVAGELLRDFRGDDYSVYSSVSGESVFIHVLEFGFKSLRRADLERAVGAELEGVLPIDLEDMVYAFEQIPKVPAIAEGEDSTASAKHGLVAAPTEGMRLLAAASQRQRTEEFLLTLSNHNVDPRGLLAAPAPYARFAEKVARDPENGVVAIVDVGHMRTDVCLAKAGKPIYARSVARGGFHLTRTIAKQWKLEMSQATEAKHKSGFVASQSQPARSEPEAQMNELLGKEIDSLTRELRRTFNACRAKTGFNPEQVVLVGGGSRLRGLAGYLTEQLSLPVQTLTPDVSARLLGTAASSGAIDTCALAFGVALDGASSKPSFDLRQGTLAFKTDLSFLRTKMRSLAVAAVIMMAFGVLSAKTGITKLRGAEEILDERVALESAAEWGEQLSASDILAKVGPVKSGAKLSPVPDMTAYDMLLAFNEALPKKDKAVLDVSEIDIQPGKIVVKASSSPFEEISALQGIKNLEESLKASPCFKDFSSPESQPAKEGRQFTLTIKSECND